MQRQLVFRVHALQAMFRRKITVEDVQAVLASGRSIETYPNDQPYPSRLVLGWRGSRPIHLVVADNEMEQETVIITVYEPDPSRWEENFERRKKP